MRLMRAFTPSWLHALLRQPYRAVNPIYVRDTLSPPVAPKFLAPFQSQGNSGSYLATSFQTAIKGANQVGGLQPTTIVSYEANIEDILDGRDPAKLEKFGMSLPGRSNTTWRDQMKASRTAHT